MGNSSSIEETEKVGYRVLGVQPNSPGSKCGFVSFFDFIIAANGIPLRNLDTTFVELIKVLYYYLLIQHVLYYILTFRGYFLLDI